MATACAITTTLVTSIRGDPCQVAVLDLIRVHRASNYAESTSGTSWGLLAILILILTLTPSSNRGSRNEYHPVLFIRFGIDSRHGKPVAHRGHQLPKPMEHGLSVSEPNCSPYSSLFLVASLCSVCACLGGL